MTRDIVVDEVFPHAPEVVWRALTTPELIGRWLMRPEGFAAVVGTRFTYQTTAAGAWDGVIHCEVVEARPPERLVYRWTGGDAGNEGYGSPLDTVVTWTVTRVAGGARVRMIHSGFDPARNASALRTMGEGWPKVMRRLDEITGEMQDG